MSRWFAVAVVATFLSVNLVAHAEAVATFQRLGDLPGGSFSSQATGVSSDGSVVIGLSNSASGFEAFRWTSVSGMVGLGDLPGGSFTSLANGVSSDGSVIVGRGSSASGFEAFLWTSGTGMVGLGDLSGGNFISQAFGVSSDGSVIVGEGQSASGNEAFRWTSGTGMVGLGDLPGGSFTSRANGVSSDGSVIVGWGVSASGQEAFRWTSGTGMVGLGDLPGGSFTSLAYGVSSDGSVVIGLGNSASGQEAFRWTSDTGMVGLGDLPGGSFTSLAIGVSSDGSVIVGRGSSASGFEAFLWTADGGMQTLAAVLADFGATPTDFIHLEIARDIQILGNTATVVGNGPSASGIEAFRAQIPIVSASLADELLNLTPGFSSDTLSLDVSNTKLLYGDIGRYEFDFTTDGVYDLVLDVGTPLFDSHWDPFTESFIFSEAEFRTYYSAINAGGFSSLTFNTTIRMTHENGTAINTTEAAITFVPEVGSVGLMATAGVIGAGIAVVRRRRVAQAG